MAVISVNETDEREGDVGKDGERTYTRTFQAHTDSSLTGQKTVLADPRIPAAGSVYLTDTESDVGARVISKAAKQDQDDDNTWLITVRYSSLWADAAKAEANPLLRPPLVKKASKEIMIPFTEDLDGQAVVTTTQEPFDPPIMKRATLTSISIDINVQLFDAAQADEFANSVNAVAFHGFDPGKAMLMGYSAQEVSEGEYLYDKVTFNFECSKEGLEFIKPLNQGFMELNPDAAAGGDYRPIYVGSNPPSRPRLLAENGEQLDIAAGEEPYFLNFRAYPRKEFFQLGVPT